MVDAIEQDININPAGLGVRNLRSGIATVQVLVRFWNLTGVNVDIIWINEEGRGIRFGQLKKNQYIDITTYEGHPWIFRESGVGDILIGQPGNISVYFPKRENINVVSRVSLFITFRLLSLRDWALRTVANNIEITPAAIFSLPLPRSEIQILEKLLIHRLRYVNIFEAHHPLVGYRLRAIVTRALNNQVVQRNGSSVENSQVGNLTIRREDSRNSEAGDDDECQKLFQQMSENGNMKEVTIGIIKTCREFNNTPFLLKNEILHYIKDHFTLLGVDSATDLFIEFSNRIMEGIKSHSSRNFVLLVCYFLKNANVIAYEKLRLVIEDKIPLLITALWESEKRGEACYLAHYFMLILTLEWKYLNTDKVMLWKDRVLCKGMYKSPLIAVLSLLMTDQSKLKWVDDVISPSAFDNLQASDDEEMCMRNQLTRIFVAYMPSLLTRCNQSQMSSLMTYTMKQYCGKKELPTLIRSIDSNPLFTGVHCIVWNTVMSSMLSVIQEDLEQCNASRDAAAWIGSLSNMFHESTDGKIEACGQLPRSLRRLIDKFVTHGELIAERFKKVECGLYTINTIAAFEYVPLDILDHYRKRIAKIMFMLLGTIFYDKYPVVLHSALRGLARLIRLENPHQLDFATRDLEWLDIFYKQWISAVENDSIVVDLRKDMVTVLAAALNSTTSGFTEDQAIQPTIMGVSNLECDINTPEVFSEGRIIRLLALFMSSIWNKLSEMSDEQKTCICFEIKNISLDRLIANMDFKNSDKRIKFAERWSCIFTIFDHMSKAQRQEWIPRLLSIKQKKKLYKTAYRLISGDYLPIDAHFNNVVVRRAFDFMVTATLDSQPCGYSNLYQLVNWPCLIKLYAVDLQLVEIIASKISAKKAIDLLSSFPYEVSSSELDVILCVASTIITPKLSKYSSELLGSLPLIFEKCCSCPSILKFAANVIKVFSGTPVERDMVTLSFTAAASMSLPLSQYDILYSMEKLLYSGLRYAHPSVNNDQCALYSLLIIKHIKAVQYFILHKNGSVDEREQLVYGTTKLTHQLTQHSTYYSRLTGPIISETISGAKQTQMAMMKLHTINDKHSSAMLAANLPPAKRREYSRVFPEMRKALKPVV